MICDQHTNAVSREQEVFADDFYVIVDFDRAQLFADLYGLLVCLCRSVECDG